MTTRWKFPRHACGLHSAGATGKWLVLCTSDLEVLPPPQKNTKIYEFITLVLTLARTPARLPPSLRKQPTLLRQHTLKVRKYL